jgi:hypothetical protein
VRRLKRNELTDPGLSQAALKFLKPRHSFSLSLRERAGVRGRRLSPVQIQISQGNFANSLRVSSTSGLIVPALKSNGDPAALNNSGNGFDPPKASEPL